MSLEMMLVTILRTICKPYRNIHFAMPETAIWTGNMILPDLGAGIVFKGYKLEYPPEYLVQDPSTCLLLLILPLLRMISVLDRNRQESNYYDAGN
jgi:hypothetical protein